jgi:hypothetical protein
VAAAAVAAVVAAAADHTAQVRGNKMIGQMVTSILGTSPSFERAIERTAGEHTVAWSATLALAEVATEVGTSLLLAKRICKIFVATFVNTHVYGKSI